MSKFRNLAEYLILILITILVWVLVWWRYLPTMSSSALPSWRTGDMPLVLALMKLYAENSITPFLLNFPERLNAPYISNWNDFLGIDLTTVPPGLFVQCFGLFLGANLYLLFLHIANTVSFYFSSKILGIQRLWSGVGALIFAVAPLMFFRGLGHLTVTTVWHLPLLLISILWITNSIKVCLSEKIFWLIAIGTCILTGFFNPYYSVLFLIFLGFSWLIRMMNGDRSSQKISILLWVLFVSILIQHSNFFIFSSQEGGNPFASGRDLVSLAAVSLTLPDLVFSPAHQMIFGLDPTFYSNTYFKLLPFFLSNESQLAYIGLLACYGLLLLIFHTSVQVSRRQHSQISPLFWLGLGVLVFSVSGGVNYLMGSFGYLFLRSNNRMSVLLMLIGLFYLCQVLSRQNMRPLKSIILAACLVIFAVWDQVPTNVSKVKHLSEEGLTTLPFNQEIAQSMERQLPKSAMVFQLPIHDFPEGGELGVDPHKMHDYDHLLPYLYSNHLRFSYGSIKGRQDTVWQDQLKDVTPDQLVSKLQTYGFSAILINRDGYDDQADHIIQAFNQLKLEKISESGNLIAYRIHAVDKPVSPAPLWQIRFDGMFEPWENKKNHLDLSTWVSHTSNATLEVIRPWYIRHDPKGAFSDEGDIHLGLKGVQDCQIALQFDDFPEQQFAIKKGQLIKLDKYLEVSKSHRLTIKSDCQVNKDQLEAFHLIQFGD